VKSLLSQALDRYLGNGNLVLSLQEAMNLTSKGQFEKAEVALWSALQAAISLSKTVIVVDGVDHIKADQNSKADINLLHKLQTVCSQAKTVKAIALCRPLTQAAPPLTKHISIELEQVTGDIHRVVLASFSTYQQFTGMVDDEKRAIAQLIAEKSHGSFLWADLAFALTRHEQDVPAMKHAIERLPRSVDDLVELHISKLPGNKILPKSILAWLLASERPLLISEIKALLEVDPTEIKHTHRYIEVREEIIRTCGSLVSFHGEFISLRHHDIRHHICSNKSKKHSFYVKEAHQDLLLRCLTYVKVCVQVNTEPTHEYMREDAMYSLFDRHDLLEYCTGYWTRHFQLSPLYAEDGKHHLNGHFRNCFPDTNTFALLERSYTVWTLSTNAPKLWYRLAYNVRKLILGEQSVSTLQSLINVVWIWKAHEAEKEARQKELEELWTFSFDAWQLSKSITNVRIALQCAEIFVESLNVELTKRTDLVLHKELCLQFLVQEYKRSRGASHVLTMKYTRSLAELYVGIHEHEKALVLYREMYEIAVEHYGYFHEETTQMYDHLVKQLTQFSKFEIILEIVRNYYEHVTRTRTITDDRRWKSTRALIQVYTERGDIAKGEEALLGFWRAISKVEVTDEFILQKKVAVTVEYSQFLVRHSRKDECLVILQGLWTELERRQEFFHTTTCVESFKLIATEFKSIQAYSFARSVYTSLLTYYEKREERTSKAVTIEVATLLAETVTESSTSTSSTTSHQSEVILSKEEEHTLQEVLQMTLKQTTTTTISSTTSKTCMALASSYTSQKQWSRATEVYSQAISKAWSSIETSEEVKELVVEKHSEVVEVALELASSRVETLQIDKAQRIYFNLFRSLIRMPVCTQTFFSRIFTKVIGFFEKTYQFDKALEVYKESFVYLQTKFGKSHVYVVQVLRSYSSLAKRLGRWQEVEQAYRLIFAAHKSDDGHYAAGGIDIALELCEIYERDNRWKDARAVYGCLWQSYVTKGKEYGLEQKAVERIYEKYTYILQYKVKVKASVVRKVAVEYRDTCKSFYGSHSDLTVKATMQLAQVCERYEEFRQESMSYYEEVVKATTSITTTTT
jgi:tetratricopeptide (TPR) repeat protein